MAATVECVVAGICGSDDVLQNVSAAAHINYIQSGADVARRTRPDATYSTVRYATPAGAGLKDGTSLANAYGLAELNTALATLSGAHVYMVGTFEPAAYNSAGPVIGPVVGDNVRLDFATYAATVRGYSGLTWTASGSNGEYYATVSNTQAKFRLTENGARMWVTNSWDAGYSRQTIQSIDTSADTVTVAVYQPYQVNDPVAFTSAAANGLSPGTLYYVKTASAVSGGQQTLSLSTTIGGAAVDITGTLSGSRYLWSLYDGRYGDPVPGSLLPGQAAYAPHESRIYIKPTSGTPSDNVYTFWQTGTSAYLLYIADAAGTASNTEVVGGDWYGGGGGAIFAGDVTAQGYATGTKVYGTKVHACESGIIASGAQNCDFAYNEVYDCSDHALGSKNGNNNEASLQLRYNWVRDIARLPNDWGDCQGLVTNPSSDDAYFLGNVCQRVGATRDYTTYPIGPNDVVNTGCAVIDSSKRVWVIGNYFEECYGETIELGPNDVQSLTDTRISGNVIDLRKNTPALNDVNASSESLCGIRITISSAAGAGFGTDYSNVIDGNLILLGDVRVLENAAFTHGGLISIRNARTDATKEGKITARNNVVIATHATAEWNMIAIRAAGSSTTVTGVDSDYNTYYSASPNALGVYIQEDTSAGQNPDSTVTVAALGTGTGWTSPDGTVSDKHSTVWDINDLNANFATNSTVLKCLKII